MSPRTEKQYEEIRQEKKALIMETAIELFAKKGYHSTSVSMIAKSAGISKGLMYNYFDSKEELLKQILNLGFEEMMKIMDPNKDGILEKHELKFFIEKVFELLIEKREFWKFYFSVSLQPDVFPFIKDIIQKAFEPTTKLMFEYFEKQGFENPRIEAMIFGALMDGIGMDIVFSPELLPVDEIKEAIIKRYCC